MMMMMSLMRNLKKNLAFKPFSLHLSHKLSSLSSPATPRSPTTSFITNYLIQSCGFSPNKAAAPSKRLPALASAKRPDSVRHFLKDLGCTDVDIRTIISRHPTILYANVEKTMKPRLQALRGVVQLSESQILKMVVHAPSLLTNPRTLPRLEFWRSFLGGDLKLMLVVSKNMGLLHVNLESITAKFDLLRDHGLSEVDIVKLLHKGCAFALSVPSLELVLKRIQEAGVQRGSSMFTYALTASCCSDDTFKAKAELYKSYGWSDHEFSTALKKFPYIVCLSKENIQKKMEFLVGTAGCLKSYIASHPLLLGLSLEKRLIPRYRVITFLKMNKSIVKEPDLLSLMKLSDDVFMDKYILSHIEIKPMLLETYTAAMPAELPA